MVSSPWLVCPALLSPNLAGADFGVLRLLFTAIFSPRGHHRNRTLFRIRGSTFDAPANDNRGDV